MPAPEAAEWFAALLILITGASHVTAPRAWARLFKDLLALPYGGLVIGLLHLMPALALLLAHPAWTRTPGVIVTLLAWCWSIKGTLYVLRPSLAVRVATRHLDHPERFAWAGLVLVGLGGAVVAGRVWPGA